MAVEEGFGIFVEGEGHRMKKELHLNLNSDHFNLFDREQRLEPPHPPTPPCWRRQEEKKRQKPEKGEHRQKQRMRG